MEQCHRKRTDFQYARYTRTCRLDGRSHRCVFGNGEVIEAQGTAYGVVKTELNGRGWTKWLKIPNIKYVNQKKK